MIKEIASKAAEVAKPKLEKAKLHDGAKHMTVKDIKSAVNDELTKLKDDGRKESNKDVGSQENDVEKHRFTEEDGGNYNELRKNPVDGTEVHHMPADCASKLERGDGPCIRMEAADHRKTASCGSTREARMYQAKQKELINAGKFREAVQMDIKDIRDKFGDKYDKPIEGMNKYIDKLEKEGMING